MTFRALYVPAHQYTHGIPLDLLESWIELHRTLAGNRFFSPSLQPLGDPKIPFLRDAAEINGPEAQFNTTRKKASGLRFFHRIF